MIFDMTTTVFDDITPGLLREFKGIRMRSPYDIAIGNGNASVNVHYHG